MAWMLISYLSFKRRSTAPSGSGEKAGCGVGLFDGTAWSTLDARDGLPDNSVAAIERAGSNVVWIATASGLTQFQRRRTVPDAPRVRIYGDEMIAPDGAVDGGHVRDSSS